MPHVLICIHAGKGSWHFSAFMYSAVQQVYVQCCAARDHQNDFVFNVIFLTISAQKCYILLYQNDHQFLLGSLSFVT